MHRFVASRLRAVVWAATVALIPALASAEEPPLRVMSASPQGRFEPGKGIERVQIVFNGPVVPLAAPAPGEAPPAWLDVDPPILAHWRWAGTATLIGEPRQRLPRSTQYRLRVRSGLKGIGGGALAGEYSFGFTTELPDVVMTGEMREGFKDLLKWGEYWKEAEGRTWLKPSLAPSSPILLIWNQPVDDG